MRARCILRRRKAGQGSRPPAWRFGLTEDRRDACPTLVIRFGLAAIKGVGEIAVEAILKARSEGEGSNR